MKAKKIVVFAVPMLLCACNGSTESEHVATAGIRPEISVSASGDGQTVVNIELFVGTGQTMIDLGANDKLEAHFKGDKRNLVKTRGLFGAIHYVAKFEGDESGLPVTVDLIRSNDVSATGSTVSLPSPFQLTELPKGVQYVIGDRLDISWMPALSDGKMDVEAHIRCPLKDGGNLTYMGFHSAPSGTSKWVFDTKVVESADLADTGICEADLTLTRSKAGTLDKAFDQRGEMVGEQVRQMAIEFRL